MLSSRISNLISVSQSSHGGVRVLQEATLKKLQVLLLLLSISISVSFSAIAEKDERIRVFIEEPAEGESYSGILNLRGWVVAPEGVGLKFHDVYIDDVFAFELPPGGKRSDVGNAYPNYPGSDMAGFSMAFNYKDLEPGSHSIKLVAYDTNGNYNEAVTTFSTERFASAFIADASEVDLLTTEQVTAVDGNSFRVRGATLEGEPWDFTLSWDNGAQAFKISDIGAAQEIEQPTDPGGDPSSEAFPFPNGSDRMVNNRSSQVRLGSAGTTSGAQYVEIHQGYVVVLGLNMAANGPWVGRLSFGPTALWPGSPIDLRVWISEEVDGERVSGDCSYRGYAEATLRLSTDGSEACDLQDGGEYFVNLALCTVDDNAYYTDWNCSSAGAQTAGSDARLVIQANWSGP